MKIIDGQKIADEYLNQYKKKIAELKNKGTTLGLGIILVGQNPSSVIYVQNKIKLCKEMGIEAFLKEFPEEISEEELIKQVEDFNNDPKITGILIQSPLPARFDEEKIMNLISSSKDVDGFGLQNMGALALNMEQTVAATPLGIIKLLEHENIDVAGKNVVIVGRSKIVGRPLALALLNRDATVTICHKQTQNLASITGQADVLIVAIGQAKFIKENYVKEGAVVIDVGITRIDGHLYGDVDFNSVKEKVAYISPVPGGVGPMTKAMIIHNLIKLSKDGR